MAEHFHLRYADCLIPTLEVCVAEVRWQVEPLRFQSVLVPVVHFRGFTQAHAMHRGQRWLAHHGDKRAVRWA